MWNLLLGANSFVVLPIVSVFLLFSFGRAFFTGDWKLFVIAFVLFCLALAAEVVLGALSD